MGFSSILNIFRAPTPEASRKYAEGNVRHVEKYSKRVITTLNHLVEFTRNAAVSIVTAPVALTEAVVNFGSNVAGTIPIFGHRLGAYSAGFRGMLENVFGIKKKGGHAAAAHGGGGHGGGGHGGGH